MVREDEQWVTRARTQIRPGVDCKSIEDRIARKERDIARMRELLAR